MKHFRMALSLCLLLWVCLVRAGAVVVVDAGHGGSDGGAVSADGVTESPINLEIARKVCGLLHFLGRETLETRPGEEIDYPAECDTLRSKKVYDTRQRTELVNAREEAVLLSIHQNSLPSAPSARGAIVFYGREEGSEALAQRVQLALNQAVNAGNEKTARAISKDVYLMNHVHCPAVLVECGFLSNREEAALLCSADYQKTLAVAIVSGFCQKEDVP